MKKLLLLFLMLPGLNLSAQNYLNESSHWYTVRGDLWDSWFSFSHYTVVGDTLIEDKNYYKILRSYDYLWLEMFSTDTIDYADGFTDHVYIREDSLKLYKRNGDEDKLIIDFDLEVGDLPGDYWYYDDFIVAIDTVYLNGNPRKIFHTAYGEKIYEGIGTNKGLEEGLDWLGHEGIGVLKCFSQDGDTLELHDGDTAYGFVPLGNCFNVSTAVASVRIVSENQQVKIFPNPSSTSVTIVRESGVGIKKATFIDLNGNILLKISGDYKASLEIVLEDKIPKGFYWVLVEDENGKHNVVKFVKI